MSLLSLDLRRQFLERLDEVEVTPAQLRADPTGRSWLPEELLAALAAHPELEPVLEQYVEFEKTAFAGAGLKPDPWFTARVARALPSQSHVCTTTRSVILGFCYSLAAFVLFTSVSVGAASEQLHQMYGDLADVPEPSGMGDLGIVAVVLSVFVTTAFLGRARVLSRRECQTVYPSVSSRHVQA